MSPLVYHSKHAMLMANQYRERPMFVFGIKELGFLALVVIVLISLFAKNMQARRRSAKAKLDWKVPEHFLADTAQIDKTKLRRSDSKDVDWWFETHEEGGAIYRRKTGWGAEIETIELKPHRHVHSTIFFRNGIPTSLSAAGIELTAFDKDELRIFATIRERMRMYAGVEAAKRV